MPRRRLVERALETLKGRARVKRTMWSRRAQEYEAKINSGDLISIAEVVRDLLPLRRRSREQSYSERQLYEAALDRMAREIAAVNASRDRSGQGDRERARKSLRAAARRARRALRSGLPETGDRAERATGPGGAGAGLRRCGIRGEHADIEECPRPLSGAASRKLPNR